ncbi:hypothetical protein BpHYR1_013413 [Brachionus plicatilis]|uniref:Uncharacterized protein n=1 Tax=Brachionus plicatilis TaxID=10195 RepID=A0A3M7PZG0_BRAPC|nr:hypothetical protein BpHYR1_013413 [Brachionus plicatilis]
MLLKNFKKSFWSKLIFHLSINFLKG